MSNNVWTVISNTDKMARYAPQSSKESNDGQGPSFASTILNYYYYYFFFLQFVTNEYEKLKLLPQEMRVTSPQE